ncbi:hypothetical protein ACOMHN_016383 [Nucella lapillus]
MSKHGQVKSEMDSAPAEPSIKGKRGRKKKNPTEESSSTPTKNGGAKQELITDHMPVEKKKRKIDRFNGMPEEEVLLKTLPDRLAHNLDILIIGINPGLFAAYIGHHYAGPGNHFWKCLYLSGLVPEPMNCYDDIKLQQFGIGFTNICARTSRGSVDLKRKEIEEGGHILVEKLKEYKPKIAVFNGKGIYEVFSGSKKIIFGKQPGLIEGTNAIAYVMPSSSARCSQLPRAIDKVPFYEALRRLRDYMVGHIPHLDESEVTFPSIELKTAVKKEESVKNGAGVTEAGNQKNGGGQGNKTSSSGSGPPPAVKKEAAARPKGRGKGKKQGDAQEKNQDNPSVVETPHAGENQPLTSHAATVYKQENQQDMYHGQPNSCQVPAPSYLFPHSFGAVPPLPGLASNGAFSNAFSTVDFTALHPAGLASSQHPLHGLSTPSSQDFMSGFYAGNQPFGMVGFPNAVASQQHNEASTTEKPLSGTEPVKIKTEPVDLSSH